MLKMLIAMQKSLRDTAMAEKRELNEGEQREFNLLQSLIDNIRSEENNGQGNAEPTENQGEQPTEPEGARQFDTGYSANDAAQITSLCRSFNVDATDYLQKGMSLDSVRAAIIDELMNRQKPVSSHMQVTDDEGDKFRRAATDGILLRYGVSVQNPSEGSNIYNGVTIREIAIECLEREHGGQDFRHMNIEDIYSHCYREFYNPTSAFPSILDDVVKKSYVAGLQKQKTQFDKWVGVGSLPNFKKTTNHEYLMSLGGELEQVKENGELPAYTPVDVPMPERQLKTYGRQFTMTREAFINDDIGLLTTMPQRYAALSANTQNKLVYQILTQNKKIYDGKVLFSAERGNTLQKGTKPTIESIERMIYLLGMQKDEAGDQLMLMPDLFIVPLGMGTDLRTILYSPTIHTPENTQAVNPYLGMNFTVVEDTTLNAQVKAGNPVPWFMGVKGETIQIDYLNGQKEATIRRSEQAGKLGFVWDVYHDFGITVKHPQTIIRNPGVVIDMSE